MSINTTQENYLGHSDGYEFLRLNEQYVVATFEQSYDDVSTDKLEMIDIPVYENYKSDRPKEYVALIEWLKVFPILHRDKVIYVRALEGDALKKAKAKLPAATLSGYFPNERWKAKCAGRTHLMCIDIDYKDNVEIIKELTLPVLKQKIFELDFVYSVCASCSGKGLYVIIPIKNDKLYEQYFKSIQILFENAGIQIDKQCGDITRLRLASFDSSPLIKRDCRVKLFDMVSKKLAQSESDKIIAAAKQKYLPPHCDKPIDQLQQDFEAKVDMLIDYGFDTGPCWQEWAAFARAFKPFGIFGKQQFQKISARMSGYNPHKFDSDWERFDNKITTCDHGIAYITTILNKNYPQWKTDIKKKSKKL